MLDLTYLSDELQFLTLQDILRNEKLIHGNFYETLDNFFMDLIGNECLSIKLRYKNQILEKFLIQLLQRNLQFTYQILYNNHKQQIKQLLFFRAFDTVGDEMALFKSCLIGARKINKIEILDKFQVVISYPHISIQTSSADVFEGDNHNLQLKLPSTIKIKQSNIIINIQGLKNRKVIQLYNRKFETQLEIFLIEYFSAQFIIIQTEDQIYSYCTYEVE
ncbi:hypothetical protein SS50377_24447 [Spironucleus salmonicida]|uniref:Uncharacterized protein n=1 Tax=Spironucleus salmonicida TaxID=348837 RepID=V6LYV0_9EUKA|nr:hypothetical protein SS50377_24447 [Spironucleus salmonicida]|eukprot:EST46004.1 Hypothetical protein SS50377_13990 [Spironucleus salmonicida]